MKVTPPSWLLFLHVPIPSHLACISFPVTDWKASSIPARWTPVSQVAYHIPCLVTQHLASTLLTREVQSAKCRVLVIDSMVPSSSLPRPGVSCWSGQVVAGVGVSQYLVA